MNRHTVFSGSLSEAAFIARIMEIDADFYLSKDGVPVLVFKNMPGDLDSIILPEFWKLDELCSERTLAENGQAYLVTDILVKKGFCTYGNGYRMRAVIKSNIEQGIFAVAVKKSTKEE